MGRSFVRATHTWERDGPLIFSVYRHLQEVLNVCTNNHLQHVDAVVKDIASANPELNKDELRAYARACVKPGNMWFHHRFAVELQPLLEMFCYVRIFCPVQVQAFRPIAESIKVLLLRVSSAACERVFSLLKAAFSDQQEHSLCDYLQASLLLHYNKREE